MKRIVVFLSLVVCLLMGSASAQQKPPAPTPNPTPQPTPQPQPQPRDQIPQSRIPESRQDYQRPVYISGRVTLDDGTPVPNGVRVELLLNGQVRRQEYTRSDGSFTFDLSTPNRSALSDASMGGDEDVFGSRGGMAGGGINRSLGRVDLSGFEVRATLPGYTSETVMLQNRSSLDNPDIGTLILRPLAQTKASTISLNSLKAPKDAQKSFESARKSLAKKNPDYEKALKELDKAVKTYPGYAAAWQLMGECRQASKDTEGAKDAYQKALAADDHFISPYLSLAALDIESSRWTEAEQLTKQLLDLNPYVVRGHFLHAIASFNSGHMDAAVESARSIQSSEEAKNYPLSHYILGVALFNKGDVRSAASELQTYLKEQPDSQYAPRVKTLLGEWQQKGLISAEAAATPSPAPPRK